VSDFVKGKVAMSSYNAQEEKELREFLEQIADSRQFHRQYKCIVNDWLDEIQKPTRRFEKTSVQALRDIISKKNEPETAKRAARGKGAKKEDNEGEEEQPKVHTNQKKRQIESSDSEE
jgi:hypothetical protein